MPTPLHLEFVCTPAEREEAESLLLRKQLGGGSRWLTWLVLAGMMIFMLVAVYFQFRMFAPQYRPWAYAGMAVLVPAIMIWRRRVERRRDNLLLRWEISPTELVLTSDLGRATFIWSGFSECLESPKLFLLADRGRVAVYIFPKRAFPDAAAQDWFRSHAQTIGPTLLSAEAVAPPSPTPADGVALDFQIGFRDFLVRNWTSWRLKGAFLLIFLFMAIMAGWQMRHPVPNAVNSPLKVFAIAIPTFAFMMVVVWFAVSAYWWWTQRKYFTRQQLVLSDRGIDFVNATERGTLQWNTYECYLENHWCFMIWHRRNQAWQMLPKRVFATETDLVRCRALIQQHLQHSRWFMY
jgi:hypothetical protein